MRQTLVELRTILRAHLDLLTERPRDARAPQALADRGWSEWLLRLPDAELHALEREGPQAVAGRGAPPSFAAFAEALARATAVPALALAAPVTVLAPKETPRKRAQIEAFSQAIAPIAARVSRVIDVGSGHGHLSRALAARLGRPVLGLDRDPTLIDRARRLGGPGTTFRCSDVLSEGLALGPDDLLVGLHACGELSDAMVEASARAKAPLALVACCLQKRRAPERTSVCAALDPPLSLPRAVLGLSNLVPGPLGVEADRATNLRGRAHRLALHRMLEARLGRLRFGEEIAGLNRRAAQRPLGELVAAAFRRRGLVIPDAAEISSSSAWADAAQPALLRWSLPRTFLARALEVFALLDRAQRLAEAGLAVEVGELFASEISGRNLLLLARSG